MVQLYSSKFENLDIIGNHLGKHKPTKLMQEDLLNLDGINKHRRNFF